MAQSLTNTTLDIQDLVTEDDTPVDNMPSEKQQRLLTEPLYSSWAGPGDQRPFLAAANVGVFAQVRQPPIVPDMFLSLNVEIAQDWWRKEHRSYFLWEFGKSPDLVVEIVSNTEGGENDVKPPKYARMRIPYYVIYDPQKHIMDDVLTIYRLTESGYTPQDSWQFPGLNLGLTLWEGTFEDKHDTWLRWTDAHGNLILTGKERADRAEERAEQADQHAERERQRAEHEHQRAERFAALLRQAGIEPEQV